MAGQRSVPPKLRCPKRSIYASVRSAPRARNIAYSTSASCEPTLSPRRSHIPDRRHFSRPDRAVWPGSRAIQDRRPAHAPAGATGYSQRRNRGCRKYSALCLPAIRLFPLCRSRRFLRIQAELSLRAAPLDEPIGSSCMKDNFNRADFSRAENEKLRHESRGSRDATAYIRPRQPGDS